MADESLSREVERGVAKVVAIERTVEDWWMSLNEEDVTDAVIAQALMAEEAADDLFRELEPLIEEELYQGGLL